MKRKTKTDKYRKLLDGVFKLIEERGNVDDVRLGNADTLYLYHGRDLLELKKRFEATKKS